MNIGMWISLSKGILDYIRWTHFSRECPLLKFLFLLVVELPFQRRCCLFGLNDPKLYSRIVLNLCKDRPLSSSLLDFLVHLLLLRNTWKIFASLPF
jgi:hypothetical protein